jgi:hypothetical protein
MWQIMEISSAAEAPAAQVKSSHHHFATWK